MELHIRYETVVEDLQKEFSALYPFLQLRLYNSQGGEFKKVRLAQPIRLMPMHSEATVSIAPGITVAQLLNSLTEIGLRGKLCRKSGNHWVETSLTDDWTLDRQNKEAMLISAP